MKKTWFYYPACIIMPHIMIVVGIVYLSKTDVQKRKLGKRLCLLSTLVMIAGSLLYYILFTPIFGLD